VDYFCLIQSLVSYIESRIKADVDFAALEIQSGFSLAHTREVFKNQTQVSLARYVLIRRLSNAAFELIHTRRSLTEISLDYGFENYDVFTRSFKRVTGITPREFRKKSLPMARIKLTGGVFAPGFTQTTGINPRQPDIQEMNNMKTIEKSNNSCVLYGVPKVQYTAEECTPFPSTLKACLNYMGQEISYTYLMAASGAAFRLRWNTEFWDGGNVDITRIYTNPKEAFERSFQAAGRTFQIMERMPDTRKEDFISFVKAEIDQGRPVIALGIVGPPEACIITGYRDKGMALIFWNFFQSNPEFAKDSLADESGYFVSRTWWENENTTMVMSIGEEKGDGMSTRYILNNAFKIMSTNDIAKTTGGWAAYDAWAKALADDSQFPANAPLPMLFERLMCQIDAMTMIGEGRRYAGNYLEMAAMQNPNLKNECLKVARLFKEQSSMARLMSQVLGGFAMSEETARKLALPATRKEIVKLILKTKELDAEAGELLKSVVKGL
jgi:AraC-like DNA-binding protein